jgi:N-acetylneuraminic acid mutarotase
VPTVGERRATLVLLLILCSLLVALPNIETVSATEDSWTTMEPMPTARAGIGVAVVDGNIYAIGGHNWGNSLDTNEMYDPATNNWTTKTSMPTPRTNFGIAVVENKIYAIGGETDGWVYTDVNEVYDPSTDTWETKTSMPTIRHAMDANVVSGKIYLIGGGRRGPLYADLDINEVYDPATDSWITKTPLPTGVQSYASAVVDNKIYIMRGSLNQIYDPETDTWSSGASPPISVDQPAAGVTAGDTATERIYVIGGIQGLDAVNLNQVYDPETDTWVAGPWLPTARFGLGVAVVNDSLYAIGGHEGWFGTPISAANERYTPADFIPEFPSWIILPLFMVATLSAVMVYRRLTKKASKP